MGHCSNKLSHTGQGSFYLVSFNEQNVLILIMAIVGYLSSKDVHVLIPGNCEYITLHGKRDVVDVIKIRILRWGDYLGLSR